ncbi:hypothetical protein FB45DRAFT_911786 [Roridomyces roridus]|uniref:Large ribosomal subunit protein mL49 n=1 Tax=Roridomyces roridus TaxID=1738132 RepID=A0AAD7FPK3_9AGAR|nr:hypothetical protein FB45DRAFT_911786 [Roridomyces roridus]
MSAYLVPRNAARHLPVYTVFRSGGAQSSILIKNVQGNSQQLAEDLSKDLFNDPTDPTAGRVSVEHANRVVIRRSRPDFKDRVVDWLTARGF